MANPANIKPYSSFSHDASRYGGPYNYMACVAEKAYQLGIQHERKTEGIIVAVSSLVIGGLVWLNYDTHKDNKKLMAIINEAEKARKSGGDPSINSKKGMPVKYYTDDSSIKE